MLTRYVYSDGLDEALIAVAADGTLTYLHADSAGSIIATTDSTGAVTNTNAYSEFGESAGVNGSTFGYAGQRYDSETGLYYSKNRYFSPTLGRFLQPDPIGYWGGLNTYAYVGNDPLNNADPLGLASVGTGNGTAGNFLHGSAQIDVSSDTFDPSAYLNQAEAIKAQYTANALNAVFIASAVIDLPGLVAGVAALGSAALRGIASLGYELAVRNGIRSTAGAVLSTRSLPPATRALLRSLKGVSGVYRFPDARNPGKFYVGSTVNFARRLREWIREGRLDPHQLGSLSIIRGPVQQENWWIANMGGPLPKNAATFLSNLNWGKGVIPFFDM